MKIFGFLRSKPQVVLDHPAFGKISLEQGKNGPYWMHDACDDDELCISIETRGDSPPTDRQVNFFQNIVNNPDEVFARAAHLIAPRYYDFFRKSLPENWRESFRLCGVGVPLDGSGTNDWDVAFESLVNRSGFLFTCYFEQGYPVHVSVDT